MLGKWAENSGVRISNPSARPTVYSETGGAKRILQKEKEGGETEIRNSTNIFC
jgi:hypothetical protein